ncbi:MAG: hypothetical protein H5T91_10370, partial [Synergistetes bacterium]|nr:hypothetical protein [Synergistota bacterium]
MTLVVGQNSYISVSEADQYFQDSLDGSIWSGLTDGQKARLLIEATFNIDSLPFIGFKKDSNQALEFPRIVTRTFISTEPR